MKTRKLVSLLMVMIMVIAMPIAAMAANPSVYKPADPEITDDSVVITTEDGTVVTTAVSNTEVPGGVAIMVAPAADIHSEDAALNSTNLNDLPYAVVKITVSQQAAEANAAVDEFGEDLSDLEKMALASATGLGYGINAALADLAALAVESSTADFIGAHGEAALQAAADAFGGDAEKMNQFNPVNIYELFANDAAKELLGENAKLELTIPEAGVNEHSELVLMHDMVENYNEYVAVENGTVTSAGVEFIDVEAGDGEFSFEATVGNLSPFVLFSRVSAR